MWSDVEHGLGSMFSYVRLIQIYLQDKRKLLPFTLKNNNHTD